MRRLYLASGRLVSPLFILGLRFFTLLTGLPRVRVIVLSEIGEVLLVRGVISDGKWSLPGGGVNRGEKLTAAARRELHEETGIDAEETAFRQLETLEKSDSGAPYRAPLFVVRVRHDALPTVLVNPREIAAAEWFKLGDLPGSLSTLTKLALSKHKSDL